MLLDGGRRTLTVVSPESGILRVFARLNGEFRLPRTWAVAPADADLPYGGWQRYPNPKLKNKPIQFLKTDWGCSIQSGDLKANVQFEPFFITWFYREQVVLQDRKTGALAFSQSRLKLQHFVQRESNAQIFGLGEVSGNLNRQGRRFELRNVDAMGYDAESGSPLYKHFPFYIKVNPNSACGVFYDNFANSVFDFGQEIDNYHEPFSSYTADAGDFDCYVFADSELLSVTKTFTRLTGRPMLPPKWSLKYSGSTMTYTDAPNAQDEMTQFLTQLSEHQIPCGSFHLSSGYTSIGEKRYVFNWNRDKFPQPKDFIESYSRAGVRVIPNIKPVLLTDHPLYREAQTQNLFIGSRSPELSQFWGGLGSHLDFTNPKTVDFWKSKIKTELLSFGIQALWNDNNEYQVADDEAVCAGHGCEWSIQHARPVQTLLMAKASTDAMLEHQPEVRPFLVTRSGMPGMQRFAQTWSGDNYTDWKTLRFNLAMALGLSLSGVSNLGHDIGGFSGPLPTPELFVRWVQHGIFYPRFVIHSWKAGGRVNEPWMYPEVLPLIREAMQLRERLIPYLYQCLVVYRDQFAPVLRPVFQIDGTSSQPSASIDTFMVGDDMVVRSVFEPGESEVEVTLPQAQYGWVEYQTGRWFEGGETASVSVSLGSVVFFIRCGKAFAMSREGSEAGVELRIYRPAWLDAHAEKTPVRFTVPIEFFDESINSAELVCLSGEYNSDKTVTLHRRGSAASDYTIRVTETTADASGSQTQLIFEAQFAELPEAQ